MMSQKFNVKLMREVSRLLLLSLIFVNVIGVYSNPTAKDTVSEVTNIPTLKKYTSDLTRLARENRINQNANFEREVSQLIQILTGSDARQPIVLDETGEYQELVVEQLAIRMAKGNVPASLSDQRVLKLEIGKLFSETETSAKAAVLIESIINELAANDNIILFVDEIEGFVGNAELSEKLTTALQQSKIRIIGGGSKAAYIEKIEKQAELNALFAPVFINQNNKMAGTEKSSGEFQGDEFRGDNVSPDLRAMMAEDASGNKRVDVILQAKDADSPVLRALMAQGKARLDDRIGDSDTMVVNLPLNAVNQLS
ncbi:MAG TPA: hypothetical protein VGB00_15880, partial [Pyrinomonadaceae bacterium]